MQRHQGRPEKAWPCGWLGRDGGKGVSQYGTPGIRPGTFCPPTFLSSGRQWRQLGSRGRGRKPRLGRQPRKADLGGPCALTPPLPCPLKRPPNCLLWIRAPVLPQPRRPSEHSHETQGGSVNRALNPTYLCTTTTPPAPPRPAPVLASVESTEVTAQGAGGAVHVDWQGPSHRAAVDVPVGPFPAAEPNARCEGAAAVFSRIPCYPRCVSA